jgi:hypothetical protein
MSDFKADSIEAMALRDKMLAPCEGKKTKVIALAAAIICAEAIARLADDQQDAMVGCETWFEALKKAISKNWDVWHKGNPLQ